MTAVTIQMRDKGNLTIPMELRRKYGLTEGDIFTILDLGEGTFILTPQVTTLNRFGDRVAKLMAEENIEVEDILQALDEERAQYYRAHYAQD